MGNSQSDERRRRREGQQSSPRPEEQPATGLQSEDAHPPSAGSSSSGSPSRSRGADRARAPPSPLATTPRPRGGGGDGGGSTSLALSPVTPLIPPSSPIGTAAASAAAAISGPAREVERSVLGSEPGVGTDLPPVVPPVTAPGLVAAYAYASGGREGGDELSAADRAPLGMEGRTASFRAGDAAAAALAEGGMNVSGEAGAGTNGYGYLNQFGQMTSHPSSSLFRGSSNTSLASSSAPQDLSGAAPSSQYSPSNHNHSVLGTLGELDRNGDGDGNIDEEEGGDQDHAVTPPALQYYPFHAADAGLHLSGGDGLDATEREQQSLHTIQSLQEGEGPIAMGEGSAINDSIHVLSSAMLPPDLTSDVIVEEGEEDLEQPRPQQQQQQTRPLSTGNSGNRRASFVATSRRSSVRSVNSSTTAGSIDSATAAQVMQAHPGTTSVGRLRTRRPSTQTRRSSDSGHVMFSWGEDSMSDTSSIGMMQGSTSGLSYQHSMQPQPSQLYSSMDSMAYEQYRHPEDGINTEQSTGGDDDDGADDPDVVRGGGRMGSHGGYVVYGNANTANTRINATGFTGNYAIGRSQSVQDELHHHHLQQGARGQPLPGALAALGHSGAYATPQDPSGQGMSSSTHFQGDTPIGPGGSIQEHANVTIPFVPDPAEPSEFMSRSIETLVLSGSVGPVPILANRSSTGCGSGVAGSASTPANKKKRRPRSNSAERQTGRGGGPSQVFTLLSREYSGRLPTVGGIVDRICGLAPSSSYLAPMEGGLLYPQPSGANDRRVEEIHLRDEFYATNRGRSNAANEAENDAAREESSQQTGRGGLSNRNRATATTQGRRRVDQQPHPNAAAAAPGRPVTLSHNSRLRRLGGKTLFQRIDRPAGGIASEAELLARALDEADWAEVTVIVSRLAPRLIGDPMEQVAARMGGRNGGGGGRGDDDGEDADGDARPPSMLDPHNPTYPPHYAGGNRLGLERLTFRQSSGVSLLINVLRNPAFIGLQTVSTNDARNIPSDLVSAKLAPTFNEVFACLREMAYAMPDLVALGGEMNEGGRLISYLFTMLSHDNLFDGAASLIEEILSLQSQIGGPAGLAAAGISSSAGGGNAENSGVSAATAAAASSACALGGIFSPHPPPPSLTFSLTQVSDLYSLWSSFNPRKLAHFCRILALLVFEPEDRQLMESPSVLKSVELLQLRRDRAARSGGGAARNGGDGCSVDRNQSIMLGDETLIERLLSLLNVMNYAPDMSRGANAYHVMAHFPWIADTLLMLGLSELEDWDEVRRLDRLSRSPEDQLRPSELGSVARMLESLSGPLFNPSSNAGQDNDLTQGLGLGGGDGGGGGGAGTNQNATHLGHIIQVINAAQRAGVIVGQRRGRSGESSQPQRRVSSSTAPENTSNSSSVSVRTVPVGDDEDAAAARVVVEVQGDGQSQQPHSSRQHRRRLSHEADAANELQFNALLLAPYQVEVLFVLCTLLGGRRKVDAQILLGRLGLVSLMDDMFERLGWASTRTQTEDSGTSSANAPNEGDGYGEAASAIFGFSNPNQDQDDNAEEEHTGIHGPGCECNPESALRVQYLRLLHNFCDRDCDNYYGRRLLLGPSERSFIFSDECNPSSVGRSLSGRKGLLSKIIIAYKCEPDDSPYKFWLASCTESYLRGSSHKEQWFAAQSSGLLDYLVDDLLDDRLHCAGSLQTAFDLLGELCKGNVSSLTMLLECLGTEERFQRLMSVAATNLVDSNVFIRALLLSVERVTSARQADLQREEQMRLMNSSGGEGNRRGWGSEEEGGGGGGGGDDDDEYFLPWLSDVGSSSRSYLTHSWWDVPTVSLPANADSDSVEVTLKNSVCDNTLDFPTHESTLVGVIEASLDRERASDWYPPMPSIAKDAPLPIFGGDTSQYSARPGMNHFGWSFSPHELDEEDSGGEASANNLFDATFSPDTVERLSWFLAINEARLLRDLLRAVDLRNINHENICCLNTAIVVAIFAHRRQKLSKVIVELRRMNDESQANRIDGRRFGSQPHSTDSLASSLGAINLNGDDIVDTRSLQMMASTPKPARTNRKSTASSIGDRSDVLRNFRELLWFWKEYYTHRGRDRLSLEFSSHLRFQEWSEVVERLCADDGSDTALLAHPVRLPKSPFSRAPRTVDLRERR